MKNLSIKEFLDLDFVQRHEFFISKVDFIDSEYKVLGDFKYSVIQASEELGLEEEIDDSYFKGD